MCEGKSRRNDSSNQSARQSRQRRANCSKNQLERSGINRQLTDENVKCQNGSQSHRQITSNHRRDTAEDTNKSVPHETRLHRAKKMYS